MRYGWNPLSWGQGGSDCSTERGPGKGQFLRGEKVNTGNVANPCCYLWILLSLNPLGLNLLSVKPIHLDFLFVCFFGGTGFWTQGSALAKLLFKSICTIAWATRPVHFCSGYFEDGVWWTTCLGWLGTLILLISASQVARITGMSHCHWAFFLTCFVAKSNSHWDSFILSIGSLIIPHVVNMGADLQGAHLLMFIKSCRFFVVLRLNLFKIKNWEVYKMIWGVPRCLQTLDSLSSISK
jgi:hypothetical protein